MFNANTFVFGRGDLGRTELFTQTDFAITHRYKFGQDGRFGLAFEVNFINLFNENNVTDIFNVVTPTSFAGTSTVDFLDATGNRIPIGMTPTGALIFARSTFNLFSNCQNGNCDELNVIRAIFNGGVRDRTLQLVNNRVVLGTGTFTNIITGASVAGTAFDPITPDARYGQPLSFQTNRQVRFGFRFSF